LAVVRKRHPTAGDRPDQQSLVNKVLMTVQIVTRDMPSATPTRSILQIAVQRRPRRIGSNRASEYRLSAPGFTLSV